MRFFSLLLQLVLVFVLCTAAQAKDDKGKQFIRVPLLYITDRAPSAKGFSGQRKFEDSSSIHNLNFGTVECSVKNTLNKTVIGKQVELGWTADSKKKPQASKALEGSGKADAMKLFGEALEATAKKSNSDEVFVIIHGFNNSSACAVQSAANLAYNVERPVVVFDWPSKNKLSQYDVDAGNIEWSQEHFDRFLEELKIVKTRTNLKFNLLAHSMGNRLAIRSGPVLKGTHLFNHMYLVDPDFDAETFVHYLVRYAQNKEVTQKCDTAGSDTVELTKVRILFSHKDHALPFAQLLFGGYTRLGQAADSMLSSVFTPLNIAKNLVGAGDNFENEIAEELKSKPEWLLKFEWIDYTALDHGIIGHTIPFQLIASLWTNESPGEGLQMVDSANDTPNRLSRLFLGVFHEKKRISAQLGSCKKVAFITDDKTKMQDGNKSKILEAAAMEPEATAVD
jgi:esterase/lipase superfamily enzyme